MLQLLIQKYSVQLNLMGYRKDSVKVVSDFLFLTFISLIIFQPRRLLYYMDQG
jgi:hypothetical protein